MHRSAANAQAKSLAPDPLVAPILFTPLIELLRWSAATCQASPSPAPPIGRPGGSGGSVGLSPVPLATSAFRADCVVAGSQGAGSSGRVCPTIKAASPALMLGAF